MLQEKTLSLGKVKKLLKEYAQLLKESDISPTEIYLFGSYAKRKAEPWSDIDVVIISNDFSGKKGRKKEDALWDIRENVDLRISPIAYTRKDWNEEISIKSEVERYGIKVQ